MKQARHTAAGQRTPEHDATACRPWRPAGFTLVELLVVIAIIALLLSILLPAINKARDLARNVVCGSNARQMSISSMTFAQDHDQWVQTSSSDLLWGKNGRPPNATKYDYFPGDDQRIKDWASALVPYLGGDFDQVFEEAETKISKVFRCPSDPNMRADNPGYRLYNNVKDNAENFPISYGVNADATSVVWGGKGKWTPSQTVEPYAGENKGNGKPIGGNLSRVVFPSNTMLYADCGTQPDNNKGQPVDNNAILMYTGSGWVHSEKVYKGSLAAVWNAEWSIRDKLPLSDTPAGEFGNDRHGDRINIAFADGHAETVKEDDAIRVRISPLDY